nr:unnamed protein product [Digitaria exilis]
MTIGMKDYSSTPENFKALVDCKLEVCKALQIPTEQFELSMGMSGDFEQAVYRDGQHECEGWVNHFWAKGVSNQKAVVEGLRLNASA